jgi:hypothetical protein
MTGSELIAFMGVMVFNAALIHWYVDGVKNQMDADRANFEARAQSLGRKITTVCETIEKQTELTEQNIIRALTKADNAFSLAHQASTAAGKAKELDYIRVKFEPTKMRIRHKGKSGNA